MIINHTPVTEPLWKEMGFNFSRTIWFDNDKEGFDFEEKAATVVRCDAEHPYRFGGNFLGITGDENNLKGFIEYLRTNITIKRWGFQCHVPTTNLQDGAVIDVLYILFDRRPFADDFTELWLEAYEPVNPEKTLWAFWWD